MSPLDRIASRRRPLQFAAAGSSFTGVDSPASAQSTSASSSPDAGATGISPEATSARSRAAWAPEAGLEVADLYGAFPVKRLFWVLLTVFCSERERPFFVPSPAIRFAERAEGVKGPKR